MSDKNNPLGFGKLNTAMQAAKTKANASNETVIKTFSLKMSGADFRIDHSPRRKNKTPHRRALVHDQNDGLTINWARDYPAGVVINGNVKCPNTLEVAGQDVLGLMKTMKLNIEALEKKVEDLSKGMKLKIETLEKRVEDLSWNTES